MEIFRLLEHFSIDPVVDYLIVCQMITVDWNAPLFVRRFPYS